MNKKILFVRTNPVESRCIKEFLQHKTGLDYIPMETRADAEEAIDSKNYGGVFIESLRIAHGEINGVSEYCEHGIAVARYAKEKGLPVVVLTGADSKVIDKLSEMDVWVIRKPASYEEYVAAAKKAFR